MTEMETMPLLEVADIETCYGLSQVLFGMSLSIKSGEMVSLMGRNGMGKTTTIRSIMGLTPARAGAIRFGGREVRGLPSYRIAKLGIGLVPFSPLGRGFLTGEVKRAEEYPEGDFRRGDPRYQGKNYDANVNAAQMVRDIAAIKHAKPGQIALAWLLHKGGDIVPIPGTKRRKYLEENVAAETVQLDPAQIKVLDDALAPGKVSGKRYADWIMATIDR